MAYITATHLLELLPEDGPLVVNDPAAVRNAPEKLFVLRFKELMPPTLLTLDREEIRAFWKEHGEIVLKPLFGNGGAGGFPPGPGAENPYFPLPNVAATYRGAGRGQAHFPRGGAGAKSRTPGAGGAR